MPLSWRAEIDSLGLTTLVLLLLVQYAHNIHLATEWDNDVSSSNVRAAIAKNEVLRYTSCYRLELSRLRSGLC